jgi:hypothetical protein
VSLEVPVGKHPQPASEKWFRWYNDPKKARKNNIFWWVLKNIYNSQIFFHCQVCLSLGSVSINKGDKAGQMKIPAAMKAGFEPTKHGIHPIWRFLKS